MKINRIVVVGAGPAGLMAAIRASQLNQDVILIEKNPLLGKKLLLSGKGRCNLTNACELEAFLERFSQNGQFLRDAFKKFFNRDLMRFFEERGLKLKTERQLRVFPVSDRSSSILALLKNELEKNKVKVICVAAVKDMIVRDNKITGVLLESKEIIRADKVILATGGVSYKDTGSTGDGFKIAKKLGHSIVNPRPGLVPLEVKQHYPRLLEGLALKNIRLIFSDGKSQIVSDIGELIFTSSGISGPLVLTLSGKVTDWLQEAKSVYAQIDFKPALSEHQLDERLLREFCLNSKKSFKNTLKSLLPGRLLGVFIGITKIDQGKPVSQITQAERKATVFLLKHFRLDIARPRPIEEAMVTRGGISLKEINPRTMESRLIKGLYLAGEIIDVDADTGGFNLQAAFSTGYLAGESAALS